MSETKKRYHHGDLGKAVQEAAVQLILARGEAAFTMRELAGQVGVSHAALYRHYNGKRSVLAAVAEQGFRALLQDLKQAEEHMGSGATPSAVLKAQAVAYVDFARRWPGHFRAMFHAELSDKSDFPELADLAQRAGDALMTHARQGLATGELKVEQSAEGVMLTVWALAHGLSDLILNRQFPSAAARDNPMLQKRTEELGALLLSGIIGGK